MHTAHTQQLPRKQESRLTEPETVEMGHNLERVKPTFQANDIPMHGCQRALFALFAIGKADNLDSTVGAKEQQGEVCIGGYRNALQGLISFRCKQYSSAGLTGCNDEGSCGGTAAISNELNLLEVQLQSVRPARNEKSCSLPLPWEHAAGHIVDDVDGVKARRDAFPPMCRCPRG